MIMILTHEPNEIINELFFNIDDSFKLFDIKHNINSIGIADTEIKAVKHIDKNELKHISDNNDRVILVGIANSLEDKSQLSKYFLNMNFNENINNCDFMTITKDELFDNHQIIEKLLCCVGVVRVPLFDEKGDTVYTFVEKKELTSLYKREEINVNGINLKIK